MSFSGYFQLLCERGHYSEVDCYTREFCRDMTDCPDCTASIVWEHLVDTTNDAGDDQRVELERIALPVEKRCRECGQVTVVEPARYAIPGVLFDD